MIDLASGKSFPTSIDNIMGERRFNEWWLDEECVATIEPAGRIESHVAPLVEQIRQAKRLERTPEERGDLALLMAFQFIRTKKIRLMPERILAQLRRQVAKMGFDPSKIKGLPELGREALKKQHAELQINGLNDFVSMLADKQMFLMTAPEGASFYLGDHPVVLHSDEERNGRLGGLGLGVPYVQIYLPLSADLMLCAYCPAVLGQLMKVRDKGMAAGQGMMLRALMDGKVSAQRMKAIVDGAKEFDEITPMIDAIRIGQPLPINREQVQCYNSLQAVYAHRFLVDPDGQFDVAREMVGEREREEGS